MNNLYMLCLAHSLEVLDLSGNNISSVRALRLGPLAALADLDLSENGLISLPPRTFARSPGLLRLDLRSNRIVSLEPGSLDGLGSLQVSLTNALK